MVDENISFADLKGVLTHFLRRFSARRRRALSSQFFPLQNERGDRHPMRHLRWQRFDKVGQECRSAKLPVGWKSSAPA